MMLCAIFFGFVVGCLLLAPSSGFQWRAHSRLITARTSSGSVSTKLKDNQLPNELRDVFENPDVVRTSKYQFEELAKASEFLQHLPSLHVHNVTAYLSHFERLEEENESEYEDKYGNNITNHVNISEMHYVEFEKIFPYLDTTNRYILRSFYPQLLRTIFTIDEHRVILQGAPGLGKSLFLFFILLYFLNAKVKSMVETLND